MLPELTWSFEPDDGFSKMSDKNYDLYSSRTLPAPIQVLSRQSMQGGKNNQICGINRQVSITYQQMTKENSDNRRVFQSITSQRFQLTNIIRPTSTPTPIRNNSQSIVGSHLSRVSQTKIEIALLEKDSYDLQQNFLTSQKMQDEIDQLELEILERKKEQLLNRRKQVEESATKEQLLKRKKAEMQMDLIEKPAGGSAQELNNPNQNGNFEDWLQSPESSIFQEPQDAAPFLSFDSVAVNSQSDEVFSEIEKEKHKTDQHKIEHFDINNQNAGGIIPSFSIKSTKELVAKQPTGVKEGLNNILLDQCQHNRYPNMEQVTKALNQNHEERIATISDEPKELVQKQQTCVIKDSNDIVANQIRSKRIPKKSHVPKARRMLIKNKTIHNHGSHWKKCYKSRRKKKRKLSLSVENW